MKINFIDLQAQYKKHEEEIKSEVLEVLGSAHFIDGAKTDELEHNLALYTEAKHAIVCNNADNALLAILMALEIQAGDEIITTVFNFISTAEIISILGAKVVFVDIDEKSYNIDATKIESVITDRTKAIIPASLFGQCADMEAINNLAKKYNLIVIEDASQSFGATCEGKKSCNLSTIAYTSFFPSRTLGAYGNGGAVFTKDDELAIKIKMILNHGQSEKYVHKYVGINGSLDAIQAAILSIKLKHFDNEVKLRDEIGSRYSDLLEDTQIITPKINEQNTSVYSQYVIRVKDREAVIEKLRKLEIPILIHYPLPIHLQEAFKYLNYNEGDFPISELISKEIMSLPLSPYLSEAEQDFVVKTLKESTLVQN